MKIKITVVADIEGLIDSDMITEVHEKIEALPFVNEVLEITSEGEPFMPIKRKRR